MALTVCAELFWRVLFELLIYFKEHWFLVLLTIFIVSAISKKMGPLFIGLIASGANMFIDLVWQGSLGASTIISILTSIAIGVLWVSIISSVPINPIIKIINIPFVFILGLIWGTLPIPIPLALIIAFLIRFRFVNYIIAIIPSIITIGLVFLAGPSICSLLNSTIQMLS
jgi:hypothetical protein